MEERKEIWKEIYDFQRTKNLPCLIIGDFNETISPHDRGSQRLSQQGSSDFIDFINSMSIMEISPSNDGYTWFHGHLKSKLDRMFISSEWLEIFPDLQASLLNRSLSDHRPLLASSYDQNWGPRPFKFINCWLSNPGCLITIKKSWSESKSLEPHQRLKALKEALQDWNKTDFGHIDSMIHNLEEKIMNLDEISNSRPLNDSEVADRKNYQLELWQWLKNKESLWAQKSRIQWLKEGDRNTKFFHTMASIRKRKNNFSSLLSKYANLVSPADIKNEAVSYFKSLFKEDHHNRPTLNDLEFKKLFPWQAEKLIEPVSRDEIDSAVSSCDSQKSPGPDGFNFLFVKQAWDIIKEDVYVIVEKFWSSGSLPKGCNTTFVALIAKIQSPSSFKDYRPISMIGCIYKIISKILARRLQSVMNHLIGPFQTSFIKGRQILDGALIASELIDSLKQSKREAVILKLDFNKAFDSVAWGFIDWTLSQMGFPSL